MKDGAAIVDTVGTSADFAEGSAEAATRRGKLVDANRATTTKVDASVSIVRVRTEITWFFITVLRG
jgi:hypothetical protein